MKQRIKTYSPYIIIGICLVWIVTSFLANRKPHIETVHTTDTFYITKWDTLTVEKPIYKYKKVIDTLIVYVNDSTNINLPIEEKYYSETGKYEAWISGINPSLDKINVFNKIEYKTVTNTTTNTVYKDAWKGYIGADITTFDGNVIPSVNLLFVTPKNIAFGGGVGIYKNSAVYKINFNYLIFKK